MRKRVAAIATAALIGRSTPEIVDCLNEKTAYRDKRLNTAYARALK
jgi:uncharacterized protein YecT (DUF1311 family)